MNGSISLQLRVPGPIHLAHAALTDEGGHVIGAEAGAGCQGHGLGVQWMREGDYKPGRGLLGEVHAAEEVLEAGIVAEGVPEKPYVEVGQQPVAFLGGLL